MNTKWDWDYFYSSKMKEWEECKTIKERREWRNRHCNLAIDNSLSKWRLRCGYYSERIRASCTHDIQKAIQGSSWQIRRVFSGIFRSKMEKTAKESIKSHLDEGIYSSLTEESIKQIEKEALEVVGEIVSGFKEWTCPIFCMSKPENIIAWEFGKKPEKKSKPSILRRIKLKVFDYLLKYKEESNSFFSSVINTRLQIEYSIEWFFRTRFPANKMRLFRPSVKDFREYLSKSIGEGKEAFLVDLYSKAYDDEMPMLCGLYGEYGILNAYRRMSYLRSRKVVKFLKRAWKEFDSIPVEYEAYYKILELKKTEDVTDVKIEGDIDSEQLILGEIDSLIENVVHPILDHLARAAVKRAEMSNYNPHIHDVLPVWDEKFSRGCAYRYEKQPPMGGLLDTAAEDAGVEKGLEDLKKFSIRMLDKDQEVVYESDSFDVYNAVYQWYWRKGKEIFEQLVDESGLWGKKKD